MGPGVPAPIEEQEPEQAEEQPQPQQEEEEEEAAEEAAAPSPMAVAAAPTPAEPEPEPAADAGKRKAEAEAAEAPSLKHLKSPEVMLTRRPLPTSGIKPPSIFASKPVPSPVLFPQAAAAAAATTITKPAAPGSARNNVACATTSSHRVSVLTKKVRGVFVWEWLPVRLTHSMKLSATGHRDRPHALRPRHLQGENGGGSHRGDGERQGRLA